MRKFPQTEAAGGAVLLVAVAVALAWVNSPIGDSYERVWSWHDARHWVNDGLMAIFFVVVGLEVKREVVAGELRAWRQTAAPVAAALGGMVALAGVDDVGAILVIAVFYAADVEAVLTASLAASVIGAAVLLIPAGTRASAPRPDATPR